MPGTDRVGSHCSPPLKFRTGIYRRRLWGVTGLSPYDSFAARAAGIESSHQQGVVPFGLCFWEWRNAARYHQETGRQGFRLYQG